MNPQLLSSTQDFRIPIGMIEKGFSGSKQKAKQQHFSGLLFIIIR